jgi:hypothetical protein
MHPDKNITPYTLDGCRFDFSFAEQYKGISTGRLLYHQQVGRSETDLAQ